MQEHVQICTALPVSRVFAFRARSGSSRIKVVTRVTHSHSGVGYSPSLQLDTLDYSLNAMKYCKAEIITRKKFVRIRMSRQPAYNLNAH